MNPKKCDGNYEGGEDGALEREGTAEEILLG